MCSSPWSILLSLFTILHRINTKACNWPGCWPLPVPSPFPSASLTSTPDSNPFSCSDYCHHPFHSPNLPRQFYIRGKVWSKIMKTPKVSQGPLTTLTQTCLPLHIWASPRLVLTLSWGQEVWAPLTFVLTSPWNKNTKEKWDWGQRWERIVIREIILTRQTLPFHRCSHSQLHGGRSTSTGQSREAQPRCHWPWESYWSSFLNLVQWGQQGKRYERTLTFLPTLIFHDFINTREWQGNLVVFTIGFREQAKGWSIVFIKTLLLEVQNALQSILWYRPGCLKSGICQIDTNFKKVFYNGSRNKRMEVWCYSSFLKEIWLQILVVEPVN